jgi:hypothetical protein
LVLNQIQIFITQNGATILISRGKLMLREIMHPHLMDCIILNIRNPIIHLPILHHITILLRNLLWKKLLRNSWSNHSNFSWQAYATGNYAPPSYGLHYSEYSQSDNPSSDPSSYNYPPTQSPLEETFKEFMELIGQPTIPASQEPSLEDTLEAFRKTVNQPFQEITYATMANTEAVARLEGQLGHLVVEFNIIEEEEFQSHEMWRGQYMINEDCPNNSYHEHVQATTFRSEEVVDVVNLLTKFINNKIITRNRTNPVG